MKLSKKLLKRRKEIRNIWIGFSIMFVIGFLYGWVHFWLEVIVVWIVVLLLVRFSDDYTGRKKK